MKFIALISGGKDSVYSACKLIDEGNELVGVLYLNCNLSYADSFMFQTVGSEFIELIAKCFGVPLKIYDTKCIAKDTSLEYKETLGDEVEDLFEAIKEIKNQIFFEAVSSGAILSNYQKNRVENVCERLNLMSLTPLWKKNQEKLLKEMINYRIDARIVKIANPLFTKECLNMTLKDIYNYIAGLDQAYETNQCGEGGEYETIVLCAPHFKYRISVEEYEIIGHPEEKNKKECVFYLKFKNLRLLSI